METRQFNNNEIEIDLYELYHVLLSKLWLIIAVGMFTGLIAMGISKFVKTPTYESTTKIYILNKQDGNTVTYSDVQLGSQLTKDYKEMINSRYVLEEVIQKQGLKMDYNQLIDMVEVTTPSDTRVLWITVKDTDQVRAMNIANCIRESAAAHIENVMDIEAVNVVETANMPMYKSGPSVMKWSLAGGIFGVLLVSIIAIAQYLLDDTIKSSEDVERYLGLSTLALIPLTDDVDNPKNGKK